MRNSFGENYFPIAARMAWGACVFVTVFLYGCSGEIISSNTSTNNTWEPRPINSGPIPGFWDWRDHNMVSPVKNQMNCNACWAFSTVAAIESHIKIYKEKEVTLSEQFLLDCDERGAGCGSASILKTFANIVSDFGGVLSYEAYRRYIGVKMECLWSGRPLPEPVVGYKRVYPDEDEMVKYLYLYGPLSAAINSASMVNYRHGIDQPTEEQCPSNDLNHAVLIVGYNVYVSHDGKEILPYWIIKNSWGEEWGEKGFYYLQRGRNACGITNDVSFPFVD